MEKIQYESSKYDDKYAIGVKWRKKMSQLLIRGFDSQNSVENRFRQLSVISKNDVLNYILLPEGDWGIYIMDNLESELTEDERHPNRLFKIPRQIYFTNYMPPVYRFLQKEWVDEFFETGKLRLSSFSRFKSHEDSQRQDKEEGYNILICNLDNNMTIETHCHVKQTSFVLCASLLYDEKLYNDFEVTSCIEITNSFEFVKAVSQHVSDVYNIIVGPCLYIPDKKIVKYASKEDFDKIYYNCNENEMNYDALFEFMDKSGGNDFFFVKPNRFSPQHEYRFLWQVDAPIVPEYMDVFVPEAIKYCRKINKN